MFSSIQNDMEERKSDDKVAQNTICRQNSDVPLQGKTPILRSLSDGRLRYVPSDVQISKNPRCNSWKGFETTDLNTAKSSDDKVEVTADSSFLRTSANSEDTKMTEMTLEVQDDVSEDNFIIQQTDINQAPDIVSQKELREDFFTILSSLYGIFLSVIGVVIPIVETFQFEERSNSFIAFYVYIYLTSILFLLYAYLFLLHNQSFGTMKRTLTRHTIKRFRSTPQSQEDPPNGTSLQKMKRGRRIIFRPHSKHHTCSFYLRLGAVGFGIGSMLLDGLYFLEYFEPGGDHASCSDAVYTLRPLFNLVFTFSQLYFVFQNSQMHIVKHRLVAKFGLIHMTATNICIWCRTIVVETMNYIQEVDEAIALSKQKDMTLTLSTVSQTESLIAVDITDSSGNYSFKIDKEKATTINCEWSELIGSILLEATPYLYPFKIEFSFICAGILFVMWRNISGNHRSTHHTEHCSTGDDRHTRRYHRISVDCAGSSRGLFLGILLFVGVVLSIIAFFNITSDDLRNENAVILSYSIELFIYNLALICIVVAARRMRFLKFNVGIGDVLEEAMILISLTGLYIFASFSIIAGLFHIHSLDGILTIVTNLSMVAQATVQTIFMMATMRMSAKNMEQVRQKPGRELVTFLLLCNFTMWIVNSFETQKPQHDPIQLQIYGPKAWAILVHITFPLAIFYRFHSTVCISHVWKQAWKMRNVAVE